MNMQASVAWITTRRFIIWPFFAGAREETRKIRAVPYLFLNMGRGQAGFWTVKTTQNRSSSGISRRSGLLLAFSRACETLSVRATVWRGARGGSYQPLFPFAGRRAALGRGVGGEPGSLLRHLSRHFGPKCRRRSSDFGSFFRSKTSTSWRAGRRLFSTSSAVSLWISLTTAQGPAGMTIVTPCCCARSCTRSARAAAASSRTGSARC
jgi:hypothetical protein